MGSIDALLHYEDDGVLWSYRIETIMRLAISHGVDVTVEYKSPDGEPGYYSINISADEMRPLNSFIKNLFMHIGVSDSPIFYVGAKSRYGSPAFSKRLAKTPAGSAAGMEC